MADRHVDDRVGDYRHPVSFKQKVSTSAESGRFVDQENADNHPGLAVNEREDWHYSPFVKAGLEILLDAELKQDDDSALNAASVNLVVLMNSLKR